MRLGSPLKNQTCEQGEASSMWPRRSRRTLRERDFHAALVADHSAVLHALVLAAQAFPIRDRTKNARAEQSIALRLEGAVVDGFRLGYFAVRPAPDFFRRGQADANGIEVGDGICQVKWARTKHGASAFLGCCAAARGSCKTVSRFRSGCSLTRLDDRCLRSLESDAASASCTKLSGNSSAQARRRSPTTED